MKRLLFAVGLLACGDDPEPAWKLERPRVLAMDTSVVAEPSRSSFALGERVQVALVTSSSTVPRGAFATHAFRVCPADANPAILGCGGQDLPFDVTNDKDAVVSFTASVPHAIVFGVVCQNGPRLEPNELRGFCDGAGQEVSVRVDVAEPLNHRPTFDEPRARIDGVPLLASDDCTGATFPANGKEHTIEIGVGKVEPGDDPILEHVVTLGDLEQLYTIPDETGLARIKWTAPSSTDDRKPVRFELILRDGRGGTAFLTRMICLSKGE